MNYKNMSAYGERLMSMKMQETEKQLDQMEMELEQSRDFLIRMLVLHSAIKIVERGTLDEDNAIKLFVDPNGSIDVVTEDDLCDDYFAWEFPEVAFLDDDRILAQFDPDDVISVDGVDYLCGPMIVFEIDDDGNPRDIDKDTIKAVIDYVEMNITEVRLYGETGYAFRMI